MVQVVIDGTSPILGYRGSWVPVSHLLDPLHAMDSNDTAVTTCSSGDAMSLNFFGTSVSLHGALRLNHGVYTASVDNTDTVSTNGFSAGEVWGSALYTSLPLSRGSHQVVLTNTPNVTGQNCVDIDWVQIEDTDPSSATGSILSHSSDPAFQWSPSSAWQSSGGVLQTNTSQASLKYTFTGGTAALFGRIDVTNGPYLCSINGGANTTYTSYSFYPADSQVLCYAGGLDPTQQHTIQLYNTPNATNAALQVTYAQVWQIDSSTHSGASHKKLSSGAIAGIVIVVIGVVLGLIAGILLFLRRRRGPAAAAPKPDHEPSDKPPIEGVLSFPRITSRTPDPLGVYPIASSISRDVDADSAPAIAPSLPSPVSESHAPTIRLNSPIQSLSLSQEIAESLAPGSESSTIRSPSPPLQSSHLQVHLDAGPLSLDGHDMYDAPPAYAGYTSRPSSIQPQSQPHTAS
ncbi:hypothetical protein DL93DRAFT_2227123 [Clavulina sp. PMI_390]|nr:hypothetical protein DL93DRAFT_2227123 [Clavulina sp. PMI_390]